MRRFVVLLLVFASVGAVLAPAADAQAEVALRSPVRAPVLDPFRLPDGPYGAGNRGIEYDTNPGDAVVAAGPGIVVFSGPVAGNIYVTIDHGGGLRTSYGPLAGTEVPFARQVQRGDRIGRAAHSLHFSTRINGQYVDPAGLFGTRRIDVRLVPHDDHDSGRQWLELQRRSERLQFLEQPKGGGFGSALVGAIRAWGKLNSLAYRVVLDELDSLVHQIEVMAHLWMKTNAIHWASVIAEGLHQLVFPDPCTPESVGADLGPPPERRIAITVAGLNSSSTSHVGIEDLDLSQHGYETDDVVRFSYEGGLIPGGGLDWAGHVERSHYTDTDTRADIEPAIDRLREAIEDVAAANPGVPIDLYGHSLGGLLTRHALAEIDLETVDVGVAMTFASPHGGSPVAELAQAVELTAIGSAVTLGLQVVDPDNVFVSPIVEDLSETGFAGDTADVAFPEGIQAVTIGDRGDPVVPATYADAPGAAHFVVGNGNPFSGAHGGLPGHPDVVREVRLALAGLPPTCSGIGDQILDMVVPEMIAYGEHSLALGILIADQVKGKTPKGPKRGPSKPEGS